MTRRWCYILSLVAAVTWLVWRPAAAIVSADTQRNALSGFAPLGDTRMYYEVHGSGDPIVFIHGGGGSTASWPADYVTDLSRNFRVVLTEIRGHGRTPDGRGPITYGRLTNDVVRLLDHLGLDRAHVVGHSLGAIIGLHLLVDFPDRVRTAMLLAGAYHIDNYRPEASAAMTQELDALIRGETIESRLSTRPRPVLTKLRQAWLNQPTFSTTELELIDRPTLIVAAGQDTFFAPAVAETMHAHIRGSELIAYPTATHRVQVTNAKELIPAIRDFIKRQDRD